MRKISSSLRVLFCTLASLVTLGAANGGPKADAVIPYKKTDQGTLNLYVYYPEGHKPSDQTPAIVLFFGGGWKGGGAGHFSQQAKYLASRGMVAICPEYRTEKGHGTDPRKCVSDGKSAMRWVRAHADELGIDPDMIAAGGGSAGGHVAAATALVEAYDEDADTSVSCVPDALVLFNPVIDNGPNGYGYERVKDYWESFSPMNNIDADAPPTVILIGDSDQLVPVATVEEYQKRMQDAGVRCDLHIYEGQKHGFFNKSKNPEHYTLTLIEADKFLESLGYLEGQPTLKPPSPAKTGKK
ncbi:MAG: alpha/beta hydrolase [Puniceicoccales bacterium]